MISNTTQKWDGPQRCEPSFFYVLEDLKFGFIELFDGKGMAIFSLALSPASRELPKRGSLWKMFVGKGLFLKNGTKGSPSG